MIEEDSPHDEAPSAYLKPANDNNDAPASTLDPRILVIARAIGRQIAREQIKALFAANDNERDEEQ